MRISLRRSLNFYEFLGIRIGFSIYSGWVTAATILNVAIFLKSVGVRDPDIGYSEESISVVILCVAELIYLVTTISENNPVYGLVYIWVLVAIKANRPDY